MKYDRFPCQLWLSEDILTCAVELQDFVTTMFSGQVRDPAQKAEWPKNHEFKGLQLQPWGTTWMKMTHATGQCCCNICSLRQRLEHSIVSCHRPRQPMDGRALQDSLHFWPAWPMLCRPTTSASPKQRCQHVPNALDSSVRSVGCWVGRVLN